MKKMIYVFLLAVLAATAFAQTNKIAVGLDTFPLLKGVIYTDFDQDNNLIALSPAFEYLVAPHFSAGGVLDLWFGKASDIDILYFGLTAHGRWYYKPGLDGLFLDAGVGFNALSVDGKAPDTDHAGFSGVTASLKAGYKLVFGKHFFVEPSIAYVYSKSGFVPVTPQGWQPGLIIGGTF
ncbi:MAG: autotransporter outer membrane beta-barrel domain-containing protein [Treponema sp.]|jgi:hypothetical protein|nr:autotransporter outer membrane beta-barrel domain-containing protein [Treponema sp.]